MPTARPVETWAGVSARPPHEWTPLQTMLWIDSLGVAYDAKAFANHEVNGSALLALMQPSASHAELEELGIRSSSRRLVLAPRLARLVAASGTPQVHTASGGR